MITKKQWNQFLSYVSAASSVSENPGHIYEIKIIQIDLIAKQIIGLKGSNPVKTVIIRHPEFIGGMGLNELYDSFQATIKLSDFIKLYKKAYHIK